METQTTEKLVTFMGEHGLHPRDLPSGEHVIEELFRSLPDGERLYRKATDLILTPVADGFDDAQRQLRDTKELFGITDADGLLIILNDIVSLASPPMIRERLAQRITKNGVDGEPYHRDVTRIFHVAERHVIATEAMRDQSVNLSLGNPRVKQRFALEQFVEDLARRWAAFCGVTFTKGRGEIDEFLRDSRDVLRVT